MEGTDRTAAAEWRAHWGLILAALFGTSFVAVPSLSLGLFIEPLEAEFGWTRSEISLGLTVFAIVGTPLAPFAGALADRFGSRPVAVPGLLLSSLALAAFGLVTGALWLWLMLWIAYTFAGLLIRSMVWNRAISNAFTVSRGLALAIIMSGSAVAQVGTPILTHWLIGDFGWRTAYFGLGLGWGGFAFVLALLFFHEPKRHVLPQGETAAEASRPAAGGLTLAQAVRDWRLLRIAFAILLQSALGLGLMVHLFPLLTGDGLTRTEAASQVATLGLSALAGQLMTGWLADRVNSTLLPVSCFAVPGLAYLVLLSSSGSTPLLLLGVLLAGYGSGSSLTITTYLTTRYAGVLHFGKIAGLLSSCMGFGAGLGPLIAGGIFDLTGSYDMFLIVAACCAAISTLAVLRLGPYPKYEAVAATGTGR